MRTCLIVLWAGESDIGLRTLYYLEQTFVVLIFLLLVGCCIRNVDSDEMNLCLSYLPQCGLLFISFVVENLLCDLHVILGDVVL